MKLLKLLRKFLKIRALLYGGKVDEKVIEALIKIAATNHKEKQRIKNNIYFIYPSEVVKCLKLAYWRYKNGIGNITISPSALMGTLIDVGLKTRISELQSKIGKLYMIRDFPIKYEIKIKDGSKVTKIILSGSADFVTKDSVIELKSTNSPEMSPYPSDKWQVGFYAKALELKYNKPFNAYLVMIYRRYLLTKIIKLSREEIEEGFSRTIDRAMLLYKHLKSEQEPKGEPGYYCLSCPLLKVCKEGQEFIKEHTNKDLNEVINKIDEDIKNFYEYKKLLED